MAWGACDVYVVWRARDGYVVWRARGVYVVVVVQYRSLALVPKNNLSLCPACTTSRDQKSIMAGLKRDGLQGC